MRPASLCGASAVKVSGAGKPGESENLAQDAAEHFDHHGA